jgi:dissimilatory sulfite reductase (desulfoviridin) alpha/beta subunit
MKAIVDEEKCMVVAMLEECTVEAIKFENGIAEISDECIECGTCADTCHARGDKTMKEESKLVIKGTT